MNKNKQIYWIVGIVILVLVLLPYLGLVPKFVISENEYNPYWEYNFNLGGIRNFSIDNGSIGFTHLGKDYSILSGDFIYYTDKSEIFNVSANVPQKFTPEIDEGINIIFRERLSVAENNTKVKSELWKAVIVKEIQNVTPQQICIAVNGTYSNSTCICPDKSEWQDSSTIKMCPPISVIIEPTTFQKYGTAGIIFVVMGLVIIYLVYKGRNKK